MRCSGLAGYQPMSSQMLVSTDGWFTIDVGGSIVPLRVESFKGIEPSKVLNMNVITFFCVHQEDHGDV